MIFNRKNWGVAPPNFWKNDCQYSDVDHFLITRRTTGIVANDNFIWFTASTNGAGFGMTSEGAYVAKFTTAGALVWDKVINDAGDSDDMTTNNPYPVLVLNPFDTDHVLYSIDLDDSTWLPFLTFLDEDGGKDYVIGSNWGGGTGSGVNVDYAGFCTNGDVWVCLTNLTATQVSPPPNYDYGLYGRYMLLDRGSSYTTVLTDKRIGLVAGVFLINDAPHVDQGAFGSRSFEVDTVDNSLLIFGNENITSNPVPADDKEMLCLCRLAIDGTLSKNTRFWEPGSLAGDVHYYGWCIITDGAGNIYTMWSINDSADANEGDFTYVMKLNSDMVIQWSIRTGDWLPTGEAADRSQLNLSPDGLKLYFTWGTGFTMDVWTFNASTGAYIDHGVVFGNATPQSPNILNNPKLTTNSTHVIIAGTRKQSGANDDGISIMSILQHDFERGDTFDDVRILYNVLNSGSKWAAASKPTPDNSNWAYRTPSTGPGSVIIGAPAVADTATDESAQITVTDITDVATCEFIQR